jgi:hypothetical protein
MKKKLQQGQSLSRKEQSNIKGGAFIKNKCFWVCSTPYGPVTFPVGDTCNIQWLIDPCLQYDGVTKGCYCQ